MKRDTPPGRTSISWIVLVNPFGPHHCATCLGSVNAVHTSSRGASSRRSVAISRSAVLDVLFFPAMFLLPALQLVQISFQPVEALFPHPAIIFEPGIDGLQCLRLDAAGAPLRLTPARNETGVLQDFEMLGNGGQAHIERL